MERMEEIVPDADEQSLQHFISNSTWDARAVMNQVAADADAVLGGHHDTVLVIDESGIPKKGENSVGVSRQYCGQTGKVDNKRDREAVIILIDGVLARRAVESAIAAAR